MKTEDATPNIAQSLSLNEWNIKGTYSGSTAYANTFNEYGNLVFTDSRLSQTCAVNLPYITRYSSDEVVSLSGIGETGTTREVHEQREGKTDTAQVGE